MGRRDGETRGAERDTNERHRDGKTDRETRYRKRYREKGRYKETGTQVEVRKVGVIDGDTRTERYEAKGEIQKQRRDRDRGRDTEAKRVEVGNGDREDIVVGRRQRQGRKGEDNETGQMGNRPTEMGSEQEQRETQEDRKR